jgi:hypothetical protein
MSSASSSSYSLTATVSVPTSTSIGNVDLGQKKGAPLPANWVVLFVIGAILVPFLLILSGIACVSLRRSIRGARVKKLKSSIDGDDDVEGAGGEVVPKAKTTGRAASATGSPERKSSPGAQSTAPSYAVIGEPLRTGIELRRGSLETVDIEAAGGVGGGGGGGQERGKDSPPAYRTTPAGTPSGQAL